LIFIIGLTEGVKDQLLSNGTSLFLGHFQVHNRAYLPDRSLFDTIGGDEQLNLSALLVRLKRLQGVQGISVRVYGYGLLSTGQYSAGAQLLGVDPQAELGVTSLLRGIQLENRLPSSGSHTIILGKTLADELRADLGKEVAVVTQAADGSLGNELYRVTGILRTGLTLMDRTLAVMHLSDLQELLSLQPARIHEIAGRIEKISAATGFCTALNQLGLLPPSCEARSWGQLSPQLQDYVNLCGGMYGFMIFLVALFAAFGVLNTTLMAVFDRTREIGMMSAMGMRPLLILITIVTESLFLALIGLVTGFGAGLLLMSYLSTQGLDLSRWIGEMSMLGTRMDPVLKCVWVWKQVFWAGAGLMLAALLAALIPARRAAWMQPVTALSAPTEG
jgi:ABC-type lipoprotein release transport system permease subunit